jgi:hypothetical protein
MRRHPDFGQRPTLVGEEFGQKHVGGGIDLGFKIDVLANLVDKLLYYDWLLC